MIKISLIIALIIFILTTWATANVCKYNYVLNKKAETIQKLSQSIADGTANSQTVADLMSSGTVNHGTLGLVGENGVKNLSEAMGIQNEDNALVSLSGGIVGSGSIESLENINPEIVEGPQQSLD